MLKIHGKTVRELVSSKYLSFATAAEVKNLTRAAERLGYTQSGISHLISHLEQELGVPLLLRSKQGVKLTAEGEELLPYVQKLLTAEQDIQRVAGELRGLESGQLRIGTFSSVAITWLPKLMRDFGAVHSGITLTVINGNYDDLEELLTAHQVDCAFVTLSAPPEFQVVSLKRDHLMAVLPEDSPLAGRQEILPEELSALPFVVPAEGTNYDVGRLFAKAGIQPVEQFRMGDDYAAVSMVRQGLGFTVLPELLVQSMDLRRAVAIPIANTEREIGIAVNKHRSQSPALRTFLEFLCRWVVTH